MRKQSSKQAQRNRDIKKTYEEFDKTATGICDGCGRRKWPLNRSHVIARSVRPDLADDIRNLRFHCQEPDPDQKYSCHSLIEGNLKGVENMLDYVRNIEYMKEVDYEHYLKFISKHK